jgi:hypothetical protein
MAKRKAKRKAPKRKVKARRMERIRTTRAVRIGGTTMGITTRSGGGI